VIDIGLVVLQVPIIHNLFEGVKILDNKNNLGAFFTKL